jgi:hypothetical protein
MIKKYAKIVSEPNKKKDDNNNEKMMKISFKKKYILNEKIEKQIFNFLSIKSLIKLIKPSKIFIKFLIIQIVFLYLQIKIFH